MKKIVIHLGQKTKDADQVDPQDWQEAIRLLKEINEAKKRARVFINSKPEMRENQQLYLARGEVS